MTSVGTRTLASTGRTSISSFMSVIAATADGLAPRDEVGRVPLDRLLVGGDRRRALGQEALGRVAAPLLGGRPQPAVLLGAAADRIVRRPVAARVGAQRHQRQRAVRVRGREQRAHRPALGHADHGRALGAGGVHHRAHVVHALLQRRDPQHPVRQPGPALVEQDQPPHRGQPPVEGRQRRPLPAGLERAHPAVHEHDVQRPVADHLVGDRVAADALDVADRLHARP